MLASSAAESLLFGGGNIKMVQSFWKIICQFLAKLSTFLPSYFLEYLSNQVEMNVHINHSCLLIASLSIIA